MNVRKWSQLFMKLLKFPPKRELSRSLMSAWAIMATPSKSHLTVKTSPLTVVPSLTTFRKSPSTRKRFRSPSALLPNPTHGKKLKLSSKRRSLTPRRSPTPSQSTTDIVRSLDSSITATVRNPVSSSTVRPNPSSTDSRDPSITTESRATRPLEATTDSGDPWALIDIRLIKVWFVQPALKRAWLLFTSYKTLIHKNSNYIINCL